jgi:hypothetical protein
VSDCFSLADRQCAISMSMQKRKYLIAILLLSIVVRIAVALYLGDVVDAPSLLTDQRSYHALGARLIGGYGFSFAENWYPFTLADTPTAHWSFLYSLFVAGVYALFGLHPLAVRLVQAILGGLLLPWMVYRLAKTVFFPSTLAREKGEGEGETLALLAAFLAAVYAYFVLYSATLMTETFYIVALLWSLERGLVLAGRLGAPTPLRQLWPLALSLGFSLGIGALVRQSLLPWIPVLFLYLGLVGWRAGRIRATVPILAATGLILIVCVIPWTIRNYLVYDDFLLLNSNAGYAMYSAQHPVQGTTFSEFEAAPLPEGAWGRSEPELDRSLMRQGIQFVLDDPGRYLLLSLSRVRAFFEFWPSPDTSLLHNVGRTASFGLFLPFMLYGLVLAVRTPGFVRRTLLLFLFAGVYTLVHLLTWAMVRYRLPIDAVLLPLAALAIADLAHRLRLARTWRTIQRGASGSGAS